MQFMFHENASSESLLINNEEYRYLFKARRHKIDDKIHFRNLNDNILYEYKVQSINKKDAMLILCGSEEKVVEAKKNLHLIWSVLDPKTIEKQLPYLNELGVNKISFYYADFSQKNFKLNFEKFNKILINSSGQCGRSSIIQLEVIENLEDFIQNNSVYMLNFSSQSVHERKDDIDTIVIGCEGGFSKREIDLFDEKKIIGFDSNLILRSETAVTALASNILL